MLNNFMRSLMLLVTTIFMIMVMTSPVASFLPMDIRLGFIVGGALLGPFLAVVTYSNSSFHRTIRR